MRGVLPRLPSSRALAKPSCLWEPLSHTGDFHHSVETKAPVAARQHMMRVKLWKIYVHALSVNAAIECRTGSHCALLSDFNV